MREKKLDVFEKLKVDIFILNVCVCERVFSGFYFIYSYWYWIVMSKSGKKTFLIPWIRNPKFIFLFYPRDCEIGRKLETTE